MIWSWYVLLQARCSRVCAGTAFAEGLVHFHGDWWLRYGAAGSFAGVAKAPGNCH